MDFCVPTNQKAGAVSRDEWDELTDHLIELAKASRKLRGMLVKALVNPAYYVEGPEIEMRRLLAALKVADVAGTTIHWKRADESALGRWRGIWDLLLGILRDQLLRPLLSRRDVRQLKFCLQQMRPLWEVTTRINWKQIEDDLKILENTAKGYDSFPKGSPRRGRQLSKHHKGVIASVELLRQCDVHDPCQKVVEALYAWGVSLQWKTVMNLWSGYKKYPRRHPDREAMPRYHIKGILWFVLPEVKAWAKKTGASLDPDFSKSGRPSALRRRSG